MQRHEHAAPVIAGPAGGIDAAHAINRYDWVVSAMIYTKFRVLVLSAVCGALAACGGGGGVTAVPPAAPPAPGGAGTSSVAVAITIPAAPKAPASLRHPLYISSATQSAVLSINGGKPLVINLTANSPSCTTNPNGSRTCTLTIDAPVGTDTFAETLYSGTNGGGSALSVGKTSWTILAGKANQVDLVLGGVVASIGLALSNPTPTEGAPATISLIANLLDAGGAVIIGSDPLATPIGLTDSDGSGATTLSATTIKTPSDALSIKYTGAAIASAVITAAAGSITASTTLTPQAFNDYVTFNFDNQRDGFNPFTTAISPQSVGSGAGLHLAWQVIMGTGQGDFNVQSQPVLATGLGPNHDPLLFVAGGSGFIDAQDALTGRLVWGKGTGEETYGCSASDPGPYVYGAGGTVAYDPHAHLIYVVGNSNGQVNSFAKNQLFQFDAATGALNGAFDFGAGQVGNELNFSHTSVTLNNGVAYVGTGASCDISSWRGRIAAINVPAMTPAATFFTVWDPQNQRGGGAQPWGGGGVWGWGGVTFDYGGNVLAGVGNTDNGQSSDGQIQPPYQAAPQEYSGFGETLLELSSDLSHALASNHPINQSVYSPNIVDLDVNGTPVVYKPLGAGCDPQVALQSKEGSLIIYDEQRISAGPLAEFQFAPSGYADGFLGVTAYSAATGLLYSVVASNQNPAFLAPGMVGVDPGCGSPQIAWHTSFGPDSTQDGIPRSVPAVSAGGVIFVATACDTSTFCGSVGTGGAVWELNASTGVILNGGEPIVHTPAPIRAPATIDGNWVYIVDLQGDLYGFTIDPNYPKIAAKMRSVDRRTVNWMRHSHRAASR